jgi:hypothetical protein
MPTILPRREKLDYPVHVPIAITRNGASSKRTIGVFNSWVWLKIQAAGVQNTLILTLSIGN